MPSPLKVAVIGAAGYTGAELACLLFFHPAVEEVVFISRSGGDAVETKIPALRSHSKSHFIALADADLTSCDAVFCATPPAVAMNIVQAPLSSGTVVIDLSPDFRPCARRRFMNAGMALNTRHPNYYHKRFMA